MLYFTLSKLLVSIRDHNKMRLSKPALFIFLLLIFSVIYAVQGKQAVASEQLVGGLGSSATVRRGSGCEKQGVECKEGNNGGLEDTVLENEDYVYTNSLP